MAHRDQITAARNKILELQREKQRIEAELKAWIQIRDGYESLSKTNGPLVSSKIGPTEAIRVILGNHPEGLTPPEIRDELQEYGISCGSEKNFVGNIHAIIKRSKDIEVQGVGGRKVYKLKASTTP
jgi:hypothetical protein